MIKHTILYLAILVFGMVLPAAAQKTPQELLRQKTEEQLKALLASSPAVTGLVAVDLTTGERIVFNEDAVFPQASAIKIPILMEVYQQANQKKFSLSDTRAIKQADVVGGTGIIKDLAQPASFSIRNLGILMIALSDNTATNSLIDLVKLENINATLKSLGFTQTRVQRKMINAAASARGEENISTPSEAASILEMLYKGEFINKAVSGEIVAILRKTTRETSRLAEGIPAHVSIAFKPGILNGVSTEWAIVELQERPYAIAMMESYKVAEQAERVMEQASAILYQYYWRLGNASRYGTYVDPELIK
ncbi:serine hydrolase [uncultured Pontibacter sp.]|uniref:serine hydrolase n=1 Tax=uncultured Pontibacter sp. TaxID=453356 RepID=UPI002631D95D|nr:serine hydrolase [uncultured Pontibacter sp.]